MSESIYAPVNWKDHIVEHPKTYNAISNEDGTITLTPAQGNIEQRGTPLNAENLNHMESGILSAHEALEERLKKSEVYNGLDQEGAGYALDARQGRALSEALTQAVEEAKGSLGQRIETKASTARYGAILTADGWSAAAPYEQTAAVSGILSTDDPFVDVDMSGAESAEGGTELTEAWTLVGRVTANEGSVTAYCYEDKPEVNIPLILKVVR